MMTAAAAAGGGGASASRARCACARSRKGRKCGSCPTAATGSTWRVLICGSTLTPTALSAVPPFRFRRRCGP
ncbi:unnamed protein product [Linum tenue]|uniref:Uncharacterized protein n=1 Tax=Linum tenue TaxID=586396 RepID=A0AAV0HQU1_9ROSI|nr:unnamed protein product [Linum tenue]